MPPPKPKKTGSSEDSVKILFSTSDTWSINLATGLELYVDGRLVSTNKKPVLVKATNGYCSH